MTPAGTSNELDVQNGWEENTHTFAAYMAAFLRRLLSEEDLFLALHLLCCPLSFVCFFCLCLYFFFFFNFYLPVSYMFLSLRRCPLLATFLSVSFYLFYFPVFCLRLCSSRFRLDWFGLVPSILWRRLDS